ncbi:Hypothetical predicted protein [Olea europaea subsp. europaea]|uniref:Uncharacterized protein n=1 Tax=Olea europaea subsp. europaea TaxID=158383 RepID=A0A8S0S1L1_OLEEU|nr:Hypothetical predicted protein [Olea europaea subsp. europaea]
MQSDLGRQRQQTIRRNGRRLGGEQEGVGSNWILSPGYGGTASGRWISAVGSKILGVFLKDGTAGLTVVPPPASSAATGTAKAVEAEVVVFGC